VMIGTAFLAVGLWRVSWVIVMLLSL
jgi:hypothetical protein